jgi:hypothetical protein
MGLLKVVKPKITITNEDGSKADVNPTIQFNYNLNAK